MDNVNRPAEFASVFADSRRTERRIITADCHKVANAEFSQRIDNRAQIGFFFSRIEARHTQDTTASQVNAINRRRVKANITFFTATEMRETVIHA